MKKGNTTKYEILALLVLAFIVIAARNVPDYISKHIWGYGECWASDCHEKRFSEDSLYCKKHQEEADKEWEESDQTESTESSSYSSSTYSTSTTRPSSTKKPYHYDSSSSSSYSNKTSYSGSSKSKKSYSNPYESYDKGYEDVYEDGDYDDDRYNSDSDYADGVDDAIDEDEEGDW